MGKIWSIIAQYGPLIIKYVGYLRYLPLIAGLIDFVRTAESEFRAAGSGAEKAAWAERKFIHLVSMVEDMKLISSRFATVLRDSASTLVKTIVEWYKDAEGEVPPAVTGDSNEEVV